MKKIKLLSALLLIPLFTLAQETESTTKVAKATRIDVAPKIDGILDDVAWSKTPVITGFTEVRPIDNTPASRKTEVRILYDNVAIYVSAMLYDTSPDSILRELTQRDRSGNADEFHVVFDTYNDKQTGFVFGVTAAGVQLDEFIGSNNFSAIWESAVKINNEGWAVEMKIPYSAIRFPKTDIQNWGFIAQRKVRRTRGEDLWPYIPLGINNPLPFAAKLEGISGINPPLRLSFTPYAGFGVSHFPANVVGLSNYSTSYNVGLDLKYGINESFTLDATLAPDFGQVQSDNQFLNLSAFETTFSENRPFFQEGNEYFNVGHLFFPRRIGGTPKGFGSVRNMANQGFKIIENPSQIQLLNATKITGTTKSGIGIGFLNSITNAEFAIVEDANGVQQRIKTEPFTNYNVISVRQTLPNNSFVNLYNGNVTREGPNNDANLSGIRFQVGTAKNDYQLRGILGISNKFMLDSVSNGYKYDIAFEKISGPFRFYLGRNVESDTYNPNDIGLLQAADEVTHFWGAGYRNFSPKNPKIRESRGGINFRYETTFKTREYAQFSVSADNFTLYQSFFSLQSFVEYKPNHNDFFEARTPGRKYQRLAFMGGSVGFSTDFRKRFAVDGRVTYFDNIQERNPFRRLNLSPRFRLNDKVLFIHNFTVSKDLDKGFVTRANNEIYFGIRDVKTYENVFSTSYIFTPDMSLTLRARHNWTDVDYRRYMILNQDGTLREDELNLNTTRPVNDFNINANFFNIDMVYSWRFAPGSDVVLIYKNSINKFDNQVGKRFFENFGNVLRSDQLNTVSIKVLYYLDYLTLKKKKA